MTTPPAEELDAQMRARIAMTTSCRDTDPLPKVADAGTVRQHHGTAVQVMHNGLLIEEGCYYGPWMTHIIRDLWGHHEPQEEVVVAAVLERLHDEDAPVMVELGSFWAYYLMWFLREHPGGRGIGMEPDPAYLEVGRRNLALNGLHAELLHGAVGTSPGELLEFTAESTGETVPVPQHDLGSLLEQVGAGRVSALMVDIQGGELALLERARDLLLDGRVRFLVVSTHHHAFSGDALTHQKVLALLRDLGAHVVAEHSVSESYSGDGLVAVSFDERDRDLVVQVSHARTRETLFGEAEHQINHLLLELNHVRVQHEALLAEVADLRERVRSADPPAPRTRRWSPARSAWRRPRR